MTPILEQSIEAVKERHPSGKAVPMAPNLTAHDRCDACSAAAQFRVHRVGGLELDFCGHHWQKHHAPLYAEGWFVVAGTKLAMEEAYAALDGVS
ncbi:hypothetical protein ACGFZA_15790 [Streptomyces sp. NPDC048211]|uniref:DUF7455 domain-containing protein n=1 Tax=Streptomyces sp. NPDC048211 TaxID=3365516 RepID=UPI003714C803